MAGHIPGGAVDPVDSATPPRSSWGCDPQKVWRCGSYVESPGDGSVLIRHEAVAERGRRYRRQVQVSGVVFTSSPSAFATRLDAASPKCRALALALSQRSRPLPLKQFPVGKKNKKTNQPQKRLGDVFADQSHAVNGLQQMAEYVRCDFQGDFHSSSDIVCIC